MMRFAFNVNKLDPSELDEFVQCTKLLGISDDKFNYTYFNADNTLSFIKLNTVGTDFHVEATALPGIPHTMEEEVIATLLYKGTECAQNHYTSHGEQICKINLAAIRKLVIDNKEGLQIKATRTPELPPIHLYSFLKRSNQSQQAGSYCLERGGLQTEFR